MQLVAEARLREFWHLVDLGRGRRGIAPCDDMHVDSGWGRQLGDLPDYGAAALELLPSAATTRADHDLGDLMSASELKEYLRVVVGSDFTVTDQWPDQGLLLYYSYHVMVGLGTIFIAVMGLAAWLLWRGRLYKSRWILWALMLSAPLPFIANTTGWMTAELGRQPWLIYRLMRTAAGISPRVSGGNVLFTLIGFMGMYALLSILFLFLIFREIERGPEPNQMDQRAAVHAAEE